MHNNFVKSYINKIKPYNVCSHKIWTLSDDEKKKSLKLDWNEATIPPSPYVEKAVKELVDKADFYNLYPSCENKKLLEKLSEYLDIPTENIQYFSSSDSLHEYIARTYLGVGDNVVIQGPSYDNFRLTAETSGAHIIFSEVDDDFKFNAQKFEADIKKSNPKLVYIVNPNNPVGYCHSKKYIEHLVSKFPKILFLLDEAYAEFSGVTCKELVLKYRNILITRTMSKAFALANFRIGYLISSKDNIQAISKIRNPKNITTINQTAAIAALSDIAYMQSYVSEVKKAKAAFISGLKKYQKDITVYPSESNFLIMKFNSELKKQDMYRWLDKHNIYVRMLSQSPKVYNCLRITIGTTEQMQKVLDIIGSYFEQFDNEKVALFDFCDTCISFQTAEAYIKYVRKSTKNRKMKLKEKLRKVLYKYGITRFLEKHTHKTVNKLLNIWQLKGFSKAELEGLAAKFYEDKLKPGFVKETIDEMLKLKRQGYKIYIVSGGYDIYIKEFIKDFDLDGFFSTKIAFKNGIATGGFDGLDCMNENKIKLMLEFFHHDLKKIDSIAYSDSITDLPLLQFCNKAVVISQNVSKDWAAKYGFREIIYKQN